MYSLATAFKTRLLLSDESSSPLGRLRLAGTVASSTGVSNRALDSYAIVLTVAGGGTYSDELGFARSIVTGDLIVLFPGLSHTYGPARGELWDEFYIVFDGPAFAFLEAVGVLDRRRPVVTLNPHEPALSELLELSSAPRPADPRGRVIEVCRFLGLLSGMVMTAPVQPGWVDRAKRRLSVDLDQPVDLAAVASEVGMTYETFRKRFKVAVGVTPTDYRNARRTQTARELLSSTTLTIKQIASSLGYFDEYHFSRRFRAASGSAPGTYRRRVRDTRDPGL